MSTALEVVLILATLAFIALMVVLIQLIVQARKKMDSLTISVEETRTNLDAVLKDTRELIQNVNTLSGRVNLQMDEVDRVLHTARLWTDRADRLVDQVGDVVEPPLQFAVGASNILKAGVGAFFKNLFLRQVHIPGN
jgi:uncharacterized protein YoxC